MLKINLKKRRYIKNRWLVSIVLILTGTSKEKCYAMGRGIAIGKFVGPQDIDSFMNTWSRENFSTLWEMVTWAILYSSLSRPILTFLGLLSLPFIPISLVMRLF